MKKVKAIIPFLLIFILTGCSIEATNRDIPTVKEKDNNAVERTDEIRQDSESTGSQTGGNSSRKDSDIEELQDKPDVEKAIPSQPESKLAPGVKLNFEALNPIDNTKYAWWLTLNKENKTPGIPAKARELISKHEGIYTGDTEKKNIYLTFDEGYENGYTPKILDILKENDVKSIFFITGSYLRQNGDLVRRMLDEGHQVGNHSINHPSLPMVSLPVLENELFGLEKEFTAKFGKGFRYMRPPMGEYSERTLAAAKELGYKTVFWSFAYMDYDVKNQKGADHAYNMVMNNLHNGAVILLHAVSRDNTEALDRIIKDIRAQGYTISPFDL